MAEQMTATGGNNQLDTTKLGGLLDQALEVENEQPVIDEQQASDNNSNDEATITNPNPPVFEIPEDSLVKIKVDGKEEIVPFKQYKDGIQREEVFTRRMQTLASQRKQTEDYMAQQYAQMQQQAMAVQIAQQQLQQQYQNDPVRQALEASLRNQTVQRRPDELANLGDVEQTIQAQLQSLQAQYAQREQQMVQGFRTEIQKTREDIRKEADTQKFTNGINRILGDKDVKIVQSVVPSPEYADAIIRFNVAQMEPQTIDEAIGFAETIAKNWAQSIKKLSVQEKQQLAAQAARAGLEPNIGGAPAPKQQQAQQSIFKKDGSVDFSGLTARAQHYLETMDA